MSSGYAINQHPNPAPFLSQREAWGGRNCLENLLRRSKGRLISHDFCTALSLVLCFAWCLPAFGQAVTNSSESEKHARVLLVTGMDYPGHLWRQTAPVLASALQKDPRLSVFTVEDPFFLDSPAVHKYDVIVIHFENWEQPAPGLKARENLRAFVEGGRG